jgi:SLT domain-containing protein
VASIEYVVNAVDDASSTFSKIALSADRLNEDLDRLSKQIATPTVELQDKEYNLKIAEAAAKIDRLKTKIADPSIDLKGMQTAQLQVMRLDLALDRLSHKHVTATVDVDTRRGLFSRLGGLLSSWVRAAGSAARTVGGAIGSILQSVGPYGQSAAYAGAGTLAAILGPSLLPTLIGGGVGLGGLLLAQPKGLKTVMADVVNTLKTAVAPLKGAFGDVLKDFDQFIKSEGPGLRDLFRASLPFLNMFVKVLEQAGKIILPVVTASLKQMAPSLPLITKGFVAIFQGIAGMIKAIGPRGMQDSARLFVDLCKTMGFALTVLGKVINGIAVTVQYTAHAIHQQWDELRHRTADAFDRIRHDIATIWDTIWRNTIGRIQRGVADANGFFHRLPGQVVAELMRLGQDLWNLGSWALKKMWDGLKWGGVHIFDWLRGFAHGVVQIFKDVWHWFSPSGVMFQAGADLMRGLEKGIQSRAHKAQAAFQSAVKFNATAGVQQWAGVVKQALAMEGLSPSLLPRVLYQMQTESGGNPNAINNWDMNARMGDPSRGLMQVIGTTFSAYHWPGTSWNIYNPLANIAAALNYARHVYGPALMSGGMGIGSGHGYDTGGWLPTGLSLAYNATGRPERVLGPHEMGQVVNINVTVPVSANKREIAREIADVLLHHTKAGGRLYPAGVTPR